MIYSDLNRWGSGSWTYEITLWRLLLQLYFVAVFALVGVQAGWWDNTEESSHNGAALRKTGNCFQIMTQRHPDMIPESVETHLRYRKESNNSLSEYLQRLTLIFCLSLWLLTFPSLQILRPNFILEKTETNGNICSYGTSESKRPGQREAKESVRTKGNTQVWVNSILGSFSLNFSTGFAPPQVPRCRTSDNLNSLLKSRWYQ